MKTLAITLAVYLSLTCIEFYLRREINTTLMYCLWTNDCVWSCSGEKGRRVGDCINKRFAKYYFWAKPFMLRDDVYRFLLGDVTRR